DDLAVPRPLGPFLDIAVPELRAGGADARRAVLDELGRAGPTVCVGEDAPWADEATIDVLTFLARRVEEAPVLLVVTFRDDEGGGDPPRRRGPRGRRGGG